MSRTVRIIESRATTRIDLADGKYTLLIDSIAGTMTALRYDEPWPAKTDALVGDKFTRAMVDEIERLRSIINEVNSWALCAPIASPEDMMQYIGRIIEITGDDYEGEGRDQQ